MNGSLFQRPCYYETKLIPPKTCLLNGLNKPQCLLTFIHLAKLSFTMFHKCLLNVVTFFSLGSRSESSCLGYLVSQGTLYTAFLWSFSLPRLHISPFLHPSEIRTFISTGVQSLSLPSLSEHSCALASIWSSFTSCPSVLKVYLPFRSQLKDHLFLKSLQLTALSQHHAGSSPTPHLYCHSPTRLREWGGAPDWWSRRSPTVSYCCQFLGDILLHRLWQWLTLIWVLAHCVSMYEALGFTMSTRKQR